MIRHIQVSPATRDALRTLAGRAIERIFITGEVRVVRRLRDDARCLEVRSPDGRRYSGVLVVHRNEVTTGAVVPTDVPSADTAVEVPSTSGTVAAPNNTGEVAAVELAEVAE